MLMSLPAKPPAVASYLFDRNGVPPAGPVLFDEKTKPYWMQPRKCGRCGGAGKSDRWAYTGLTCYDCGGSGQHKNGPEAVRLYTVEQNRKLDVTRDKARERKATEERTKREAFEKRAQENSAAFKAQYGDLLKRAWDYLVDRFGWDEETDEVAYVARGNFVYMIVAKAERQSEIMQSQVDAIETELARWDAMKAAKAASRYVGGIGEKVTLTVTVTTATSFVRKKFNAPWIEETIFVRVMKDESGNTFKCFSSAFSPRKGSKLVITGKVKGHETYNDECQTVLNFVKIKTTIETPPETDIDDR